jgi:glycosyltransferase involved in cell wall biosynthesis
MRDKRCRLLIVCQGYPPFYGGAEHVACHLAETAAADPQWQAQVLTSDIGGRLAAHESRNGVEIVRVPARKRHWARHSVPELLAFYRAACRFQPDYRPDLIWGHFTLPGGAVAARLARRCGAPYAITLHGSDVPGYQNARFGLLYILLKPWIRTLWRNARHVVAVSEPLRDLALRSAPQAQIATIPNGVEIERFHPGPLRSPTPADVRLIVVAQLIARKGIQHLLAALAMLPDTHRRRIVLEVCGIGPAEQTLRRQAHRLGLAERVCFLGLVPHDQLPSRLQHADIFVLPSLQEGWPVSILEAMACELPCIATAVGGVPAMIRHASDGLLVPPGDAPALCGALKGLLESPDLRRSMGKAARLAVIPYAWPRIWQRYAALLRSGIA